ncbi:hypothetical protein [Agrobacterium tumefaciens]|uniref:hypothetical protein n=1 Tax=Agrobacterium tumefaciens TaxID=358 RepID=UPI0021D1B927|nr:hypothetical protein [Agrobacterium tumefaciens]
MTRMLGVSGKAAFNPQIRRVQDIDKKFSGKFRTKDFWAKNTPVFASEKNQKY